MLVTVVNSLVIGANPPAPLSVSSISPANGSTGFIGGPITITFNKNPNGTSGSAIYVNGVTTTNAYSSESNATILSTAYLAPNTTYTFKVNKVALASLQTDGETTATCGTAMTDVSGVCQSTFTTAYLKIYSVGPAAGSTNVVGTDGTTGWNVVPNITFGTTKVLTAGQYTCSSSYYNGTSWVTDSTPGAFTNTSNAIYSLPSMIFHKSYDESHLTTYTCSVPKSIGLSTCDAGTTDTGTLCQWTFTTAP
ncbi:Ig-like domain-containing protein [Trichlorobacter lovleyi]|uniref:Ig-like domain-containing protein n=1 Tax=Trichlorobacter lovleyi TaxID=313985 RepID=UPI0023F54372|nr:Ig-like domain-containing protein [Trichlorobacter lovleyi]